MLLTRSSYFFGFYIAHSPGGDQILHKGSGFSVRRNLSQNRRCQILESPTRSLPAQTLPRLKTLERGGSPSQGRVGCGGTGRRQPHGTTTAGCNLECKRRPIEKENNISYQIPQKQPTDKIKNHGGLTQVLPHTRAVLGILFDGEYLTK